MVVPVDEVQQCLVGIFEVAVVPLESLLPFLHGILLPHPFQIPEHYTGIEIFQWIKSLHSDLSSNAIPNGPHDIPPQIGCPQFFNVIAQDKITVQINEAVCVKDELRDGQTPQDRPGKAKLTDKFPQVKSMWHKLKRSLLLQEPETRKLLFRQIWREQVNDQIAASVIMQNRRDGNQDKMKVSTVADNGDMNWAFVRLHGVIFSNDLCFFPGKFE